MARVLVALLGLIMVAGAQAQISAIAEQYVKLGLALGQHDADYVDAFYGPPEWKAEASRTKLPLRDIEAQAIQLAARLGEPSAEERRDERVMLRYAYLRQQLEAMAMRARIVGGAKVRFDEESRVVSGAVAPRVPDAQFDAALQDLDRLLPGKGPLGERYDAFRKDFVIPPERIDAVFTAALAECRRRTLAHIELPTGESFAVEYVRGKPWSAYMWYRGNYQSLIQVNIDLPMHIGQAVYLACHEGYPGHHAFYALLEKNFVRDRGWAEFSFFPLFSPHSLISEGSADFGVELVFPDEEVVAFWRDVLFPLAGLDPARAAQYHKVGREFRKLAYAGIQAARRYLDGESDRAATIDWLVRYTLSPRPYAERRMRFFDTYRSYTINYDVGRALVRNYVNARAGDDQRPERRWQEFFKLLMSLRLPPALGAASQ